MKVIIAGSRGFTCYSLLGEMVQKAGFHITEVVSGRAPGVDTLGERWALENGIKVKKFPAEWTRYGKGAGYIRNEEMAKYADVLIAVWDGKSRGTQHMIDMAKKHRLKIAVLKQGEDFILAKEI